MFGVLGVGIEIFQFYEQLYYSRMSIQYGHRTWSLATFEVSDAGIAAHERGVRPYLVPEVLGSISSCFNSNLMILSCPRCAARKSRRNEI